MNRLNREPRSFISNRGPRLDARKQDMLTQKIQPFDIHTDASPPTSLGLLFKQSGTHFGLEIGFGGGEHLMARLQRNDGMLWFGCEPYKVGVIKLLNALDEAPELAKKLRLYQDDARNLLDWLPNESLSLITLLYPDPWPKARHHKRRFISKANLDRMARTLKPGGLFSFATDSADYVDWCLRLVRRHARFSWQAERPSDWLIPEPSWPGTRYEAKALAAGRTPTYLTFRRKA